MKRAGSSLYRFVDLVALTYHEARNVRHLVREGLLEPERYSTLMSLPTNKFKAWKDLSALREEASVQGDVQSALRVFSDRFDITLAELEILYKHEGWRNAQIGGNAWARIAAAVNDLATALGSGDSAAASSLFVQILEMRHNTGVIEEKLDLLEKT
ncbi:MAG: hypothetical protein M3280_10260 [Actinomycetota bacterium]|nr:hypothetical protein [Actinomycetota bacterium]